MNQPMLSMDHGVIRHDGRQYNPNVSAPYGQQQGGWRPATALPGDPYSSIPVGEVVAVSPAGYPPAQVPYAVPGQRQDQQTWRQ